jgi:dipeptidyl-peptidase-4
MMAGLLLLLLLLAPAFGQKKPITLETLNLPPRRDTPGPAVWAPNGKMFAYEQGDKLMIYNPARKSSRMVVSTEAMSDAAVKVPDNGPAAWQDRYVREAGLQWSPSGKDLLYAAGGDLFLIHADNGKWEQLTATAAEEQDPKFSPDGKSISFRRGFDLYARDIATGKETRLTTGGSGTLRNGGLDWVYPEEIGLDTAYWWAPDSRSIAYLQFDVSREPLYPHEDLLKARAVFEPERYPQAGENNADVHLGVVAATGGATRWRYAERLRDRPGRLGSRQQERLCNPHQSSAESSRDVPDQCRIRNIVGGVQRVRSVLDQHRWRYHVSECRSAISVDQ